MGPKGLVGPLPEVFGRLVSRALLGSKPGPSSATEPLFVARDHRKAALPHEALSQASLLIKPAFSVSWQEKPLFGIRNRCPSISIRRPLSDRPAWRTAAPRNVGSSVVAAAARMPPWVFYRYTLKKCHGYSANVHLSTG